MGNRSTETRHGGGAKITKITKFTKKTKQFFLVVFVAFVFLEPQPSAVSGQAAANWTQFRGNARLTGIASADLPATLSLKWTYEAVDAIESSAAIADGVVYAGAGNGDLLAIDLGTGKLRWKYKTGDMIGESSPAVGGGLVYVGDLSGVFHAVNVKDGSRAWTFKTGSEIKSSPVIAGDIVLIGSYDTHLYALDARTGKELWHFNGGDRVFAAPITFLSRGKQVVTIAIGDLLVAFGVD